MRAWLNLRSDDRVRLYGNGLQRLGYKVGIGLTHTPRPDDLLVTWNRIGFADAAARAFEIAGNKVLVTENAAWGNDFAGNSWYSLAWKRHNTAGLFPVGDSDRWNSLGVELSPWRTSGETVILPQRGIGAAPTAMPRGWTQQALSMYGGRVRAHPGIHKCIPLMQDLANAGRVITWGSGAAIKAAMHGIPVVSEMHDWIGAQDNTDAGRLAMLRRLAWAQWRRSEIESGEAFAWLLKQ